LYTFSCIHSASSLTSITIANLQSATMFKVYLRSCDDPEPISRVLKVQTKQAVPGPVTKQNVVMDKDGIALQWDKPRLANGIVLYYQIEWTNKNGTEAYTTNVEPEIRMYRFPNVTVHDKFNITIRAINVAGLGIPVYLNMSQVNDTTDAWTEHHEPNQPENPLLGIVIGLLLALVFIVVCTWCLLKNRTCKKHWNVGHNNHPLPAGPGNGPNPPNTQLNSNHTGLHEMQTLIRKNELPPLVPNGKTTTAKILLDGKGQFENCHSEHEKKRGHVTTYSDLELSDTSEADDEPKHGPLVLANGQVLSFRVAKGSPPLHRAQNHLDSQITGIEVINSKPPSFSSFISRTDSSPTISPIAKSVFVDDVVPVAAQVEPCRTNSNHFLDYVESSPSSSTISSINSANTVIHNQSPLVTTKKTHNHNQQQQQQPPQQQPPQQHSSIFINNNNNSNNSSIKSNSNHNRIKDNLQVSVGDEMRRGVSIFELFEPKKPDNLDKDSIRCTTETYNMGFNINV
jgi:Fibronectin type III domain